MMMKFSYMVIKIKPETHFVFDLDDTIFQEIDFLKSAYRAIARDLAPAIGQDIYEQMWQWYSEKKNVFQLIIDSYGHLIPDQKTDMLLHQYRQHIPEIRLAAETEKFLNELKEYSVPLGLITDGRSITQRNKLKALGIDSIFSDIIISEEFGSEKPNPANYMFFVDRYPGHEFWFFGDNTRKDFIVPIQLGWKTVCIRNRGSNIHPQDLAQANVDYCINSFNELNIELSPG